MFTSMPLGEDGEADYIYDLRKTNEGRPEGNFEPFYTELGKLLEEYGTAAEERRKSLAAHLPIAVSTFQLIKKEKKKRVSTLRRSMKRRDSKQSLSRENQKQTENKQSLALPKSNPPVTANKLTTSKLHFPQKSPLK